MIFFTDVLEINWEYIFDIYLTTNQIVICSYFYLIIFVFAMTTEITYSGHTLNDTWELYIFPRSDSWRYIVTCPYWMASRPTYLIYSPSPLH